MILSRTAVYHVDHARVLGTAITCSQGIVFGLYKSSIAEGPGRHPPRTPSLPAVPFTYSHLSSHKAFFLAGCHRSRVGVSSTTTSAVALYSDSLNTFLAFPDHRLASTFIYMYRLHLVSLKRHNDCCTQLSQDLRALLVCGDDALELSRGLGSGITVRWATCRPSRLWRVTV